MLQGISLEEGSVRLPAWVMEGTADFVRSYESKIQAGTFLKGQRIARGKKEKDRAIKQKFEQMSERLRSLGLPSQPEGGNKDNSDDDAGALKGAPRDFEFEVGMVDARLDSPTLKLPESKDKLFVIKAIGDYEPLKPSEEVKD